MDIYSPTYSKSLSDYFIIMTSLVPFSAECPFTTRAILLDNPTLHPTIASRRLVVCPTCRWQSTLRLTMWSPLAFAPSWMNYGQWHFTYCTFSNRFQLPPALSTILASLCNKKHRLFGRRPPTRVPSNTRTHVKAIRISIKGQAHAVCHSEDNAWLSVHKGTHCRMPRPLDINVEVLSYL